MRFIFVSLQTLVAALANLRHCHHQSGRGDASCRSWKFASVGMGVESLEFCAVFLQTFAGPATERFHQHPRTAQQRATPQRRFRQIPVLPAALGGFNMFQPPPKRWKFEIVPRICIFLSPELAHMPWQAVKFRVVIHWVLIFQRPFKKKNKSQIPAIGQKKYFGLGTQGTMEFGEHCRWNTSHVCLKSPSVLLKSLLVLLKSAFLFCEAPCLRVSLHW